jgi:NAD(P)-dependent dehydrogenase (short-subunit alcohol dehydrogenase family)
MAPATQETPMQTVLITGANRGIGLELTRHYAAAGDHVLACCREPAKAAALQALAGKNVSVLGVHVADGVSVAALAKQVADRPIDVLINNAGMAGPAFAKQSLEDMDYDGWAETFAVNTMAPFRMLQAFRGNLRAGKNPRAVTITSQMGAIAWGFPVMYAYCSTKGAVNKVMKMASAAMQKEGISVLLVHPGFVKTDMGGPNAEITPEASAAGIAAVIDKASIADTGRFFKWNGEEHPW